jgi:hypothetical protein
VSSMDVTSVQQVAHKTVARSGCEARLVALHCESESGQVQGERHQISCPAHGLVGRRLINLARVAPE